MGWEKMEGGEEVREKGMVGAAQKMEMVQIGVYYDMEWTSMRLSWSGISQDFLDGLNRTSVYTPL